MTHKLICLLVSTLAFVSCSGPQLLFESPYQRLDNRNVLRQYFRPMEPIIQPGDKITISIWGHDELSIGSVNTSFSSNEATGKWVVVDNDGEVNLPQIGRIKVAGYDIKEVNYLLEEKYSELLKDPIINVKVLNHFVTVLGEVNNPGKYQLDNEQVSLVQMIGEAKGLTPYAKGQDVKVIRKVNNQPVELVVDFTDLASFTDYNIILQPDDIIYIGANKKKGADEKLRRATTITGILTGLAVVASIIFK